MNQYTLVGMMIGITALVLTVVGVTFRYFNRWSMRDKESQARFVALHKDPNHGDSKGSDSDTR